MSDRIAVFSFNKDVEERLDHFLVECFPEFSRSRLQGLIKDGFVTIDGHTAKKAGVKLQQGEQVQVRIPPPQPVDLIAENIPLDILFENEDLLVINKPAGMVVHPAAGHDSGTLVHAVLGHDPDLEGIGGETRPGIVHRLDKETSGIILVAKNERSHRWLQNQFRTRKVAKTYLALVDGSPPTPAGRVEAPIGRDPSNRKQMAIVTPGKGREAVSEYHTLEIFKGHALLEVRPLTGRTHQVRLHCAFLGCPIVGDKVYGRRKSSLEIDRHFLHAYRISIKLPGKAVPQVFEAPLPPDLGNLLEYLRMS